MKQNWNLGLGKVGKGGGGVGGIKTNILSAMNSAFWDQALLLGI